LRRYDEELKKLEEILPARSPVGKVDMDTVEECSMHDVDMEAEMRRSKNSQRQGLTRSLSST
jgi:hypothetical protein